MGFGCFGAALSSELFFRGRHLASDLGGFNATQRPRLSVNQGVRAAPSPEGSQQKQEEARGTEPLPGHPPQQDGRRETPEAVVTKPHRVAPDNGILSSAALETWVRAQGAAGLFSFGGSCRLVQLLEFYSPLTWGRIQVSASVFTCCSSSLLQGPSSDVGLAPVHSNVFSRSSI